MRKLPKHLEKAGSSSNRSRSNKNFTKLWLKHKKLLPQVVTPDMVMEAMDTESMEGMDTHIVMAVWDTVLWDTVVMLVLDMVLDVALALDMDLEPVLLTDSAPMADLDAEVLMELLIMLTFRASQRNLKRLPRNENINFDLVICTLQI
jgi:hypothetical protein